MADLDRIITNMGREWPPTRWALEWEEFGGVCSQNLVRVRGLPAAAPLRWAVAAWPLHRSATGVWGRGKGGREGL